MKRWKKEIFITAVAVLLSGISGCGMIWHPEISNEFAVRETRERFDLIHSGIFEGTPAGDDGFLLPMGFVGPGIIASTYPPRGVGTAFLLTIASPDGRNLKPGMYRFNPDDDIYRPGTFSFPEFYMEYNMNDFEPRIGSKFYQCNDGTINIYKFSETEINLSWALEIEEYTDTGSEPEPTGQKSIADGNYSGEYTFYDVPVTTEHKGFNFDGVFYPLGTAAVFAGEQLGENYSYPIVIGGPDAQTSDWPMSGIDSYVVFNLVSESPDSLDLRRYEFVPGGANPGECSRFITVNDTDFSDFGYVNGSLVYQPVGGFCDVGIYTEDYLEILWTMEIVEYLYDGRLIPTEKSSVLNGAYSGPLTHFDFPFPADRRPTEGN